MYTFTSRKDRGPLIRKTVVGGLTSGRVSADVSGDLADKAVVSGELAALVT